MTNRPAVRVLILVLCAAVALSALAGIAVAAVQRPPLLFMVGLELSVLLAAVFGVLVGRGRFADGRAITLLCAGAAIAIGSYMAALSAFNAIGGVSLRPIRDARLAAGGLLVVLAALEVLARRPGVSLRYLGIGLLLGLPVVAGAAWLFVGGGARAFASLGEMTQVFVALIGFALFCGLTSVSAHYLIRAFVVGVEEGERRVHGAADSTGA